MFEDRAYKRTFYSAPQSVTSLVAALMEPATSVFVFLALSAWVGQTNVRADQTLCLLVFALTFPGRNRFRDRPLNAAVDISAAWLRLLVILLLCAYATRSLELFSPVVLLWWALATPVLQWLAYFGARRTLHHLARQPGNQRTAVVVGAGALGVKVARAFVTCDNIGPQFLGYFDDRADDRVDREAAGQRLGSLRQLAPFIRDRGVQEVYITVPLESQRGIVDLMAQVQGTTASVFFVPDAFGASIIQGRLQDLNGVPVVSLCESPFTGTNRLVKRLSDIALASFVLLVTAPVLLAVALGVKLSSPGPVLFRQRRNGLDGEEIVVYKFRSTHAQDDTEAVHRATRAAPRVTAFGTFICRASLDELPQFFNVLQGRLSIVGPRPHATTHHETCRRIIKDHMTRHTVKPGITGWAQIHGHRGEPDTVEETRSRVEYDLEYLRNWSLGLDLRIIARTIERSFFKRYA